MAVRHFQHPVGGQHDCELLGGGLETAEGEAVWKECKKNPGHEEFIAVQDFLDNYEPMKQCEDSRALLRAMIDLTVRLRVSWTNPARPDNDVFSDVRGSDKLRLGTGFILNVDGPVTNETCPCEVCCGRTVAKSWRFLVRTAHHLVYDTLEAQETLVDIFYDDDEIGKKETVRALKVVKSYPERDICEMLCVTHDEDLAGRVQCANLCWWRRGSISQELPLVRHPLLYPSMADFKYLVSELFSHDIGLVDTLGMLDKLGMLDHSEDGDHSGVYLGPSRFLDYLSLYLKDWQVLVLSHPHGKTKKVTVGAGRSGTSQPPLLQLGYNAATCPGSSGAPVVLLDSRGVCYSRLLPLTHCGSLPTNSTQHEDRPDLPRGQKTKWDQCNYANFIRMFSVY